MLPPTYEPRATDYIRRPEGGEDMTSMIETLVRNGHAYVAEDHVLFDVASMPDYGRLSNRSLDEMEAGARVEVAPYKKGPMDFVLWKPSKPGEPAWPSPAGIKTPGRPGWHIECSAMAGALLGPVFDIHGGGIDLTFPHHENEIAQSRCAHNTSVMANVWMHNGFLQVEGDKMSKSLGNFITIRELLDDGWPGEVVRLNMLRTHYRQPIDWTEKGLEESQKILGGWFSLEGVDTRDRSIVAPAFLEALEDDLNTPKAIAELHVLAAAKDGKALGAALGSTWLRRHDVESGRRACGRDGAGGGFDGRAAHRRPPRSPQAQGLRGVRSHPRRADRHGHHAQRQQEQRHWRDRNHLGSRAVDVPQIVILGFMPRIHWAAHFRHDGSSRQARG